MRPVRSILLVILTGCSSCNETVRVRVIGTDKTGFPDAKYYILRGPNTTLEELSTVRRFIVPGILGEAGDEFSIQTEFRLH